MQEICLKSDTHHDSLQKVLRNRIINWDVKDREGEMEVNCCKSPDWV
jgi:hypothetical protein